MNYPCSNCQTSSVYWRISCFQECRLYRHYIKQVQKYYDKHKELPKYTYTHYIKWVTPETRP